MMRWALRYRRLILAGLALLSIVYAVILLIVPWRFCHSQGYVFGSLTVLALVVLESVDIWGRRHDGQD